MADDPGSRPPPPPWGREEPLFGPRPGVDPEAGGPGPPHAAPGDDPFDGPLFGESPDRGRSGAGHDAPGPRLGPDVSRSAPPPQAGGSSDGPDDERWTDGHTGGSWSDGRDDRRGTDGSDDDPWSRAGGSEPWPPAGSSDDRADRPRSEIGAHPDRGTPDERGEEVAPDAAATPAKQRGSTASFFRELPVLLLIAFVLAFLLRTFVLQVFYIPSSSMEPTLQINDRMAVEKLTYLFREPRRGEIVVFEGEELGQTDPDADLGERVVRGVGQFLGVVPASAKDYVKRVIGLPGDEILIEDGLVLVNGEPIDEPYVVYPDGASYGPVTVPDDSLFFLGDNRPNSSDSRRGLGFVPLDDVVGRSFVTIWPPDNMGSLTGVEHELPDDP